MYFELNKKVKEVSTHARRYDNDIVKIIDDIIVEVRLATLSNEKMYIIIDDVTSIIFEGLDRGQTITEVLGEDHILYIKNVLEELEPSPKPINSIILFVGIATYLLIATIYSVISNITNQKSIAEIEVDGIIFLFFVALICGYIFVDKLSTQDLLKFDIVVIALSLMIVNFASAFIFTQTTVVTNPLWMLLIICGLYFSAFYIDRISKRTTGEGL